MMSPLFAQTVKLKAEARLNLLRDVGVAVDVWLKSAMNQVMEELENERWAVLNTHDASFSVSLNHLQSKPDLCRTVQPILIMFYNKWLKHSVDFDREDDEDTETLDDSSSSPSSTHRNYPLTCSVLYSYQVHTQCGLLYRPPVFQGLFVHCDVIFCALFPQASQPDELTIQEQEILELIDDGDMEDWVKVHARTVFQKCV